MSVNHSHGELSDLRALTDREQAVLRSVVQTFVQTADPVGSRLISKHHMPGLSAASIRNTMSDLEELGYLDHPYTSAGRIPTDLGYRTYVNELMEMWQLPAAQRRMLRNQLLNSDTDTDAVLRRCARLLGHLSNLLGVALSPKLSAGILERMEVIPLSTSRLMFVISVRSGMVKTIVLEVESDVRRNELDAVVAVLNERLAGLTLEEIRKTFASRVKDLVYDDSGIIKLVLKRAPVIFSDLADNRRFTFGGAQNIVVQPEFREPADMRNVIELLEQENVVVHLLEDRSPDEEDDLGQARVRIGREIADEKAEKYSIVSARYKIGEMVGTIGVIGPTRMDYGKVMSVVEFMATLLSRSPEELQN